MRDEMNKGSILFELIEREKNSSPDYAADDKNKIKHIQKDYRGHLVLT